MPMLSDKESQLEETLESRYETAQIADQFLRATTEIHGHLEEAFDIRLDLTTYEERTAMSFIDKAEKISPTNVSRYDLVRINRQRNAIVHKGHTVNDYTMKATADGFVDFTLAAWRDIFGASSTSPTITRPKLGTLDRTPPPPETRPQEPRVEVVPSEPKKSIPWRSLLAIVLLFIGIPLFAGFTIQLWSSEASPYWSLLATGLLLFLVIIGLRELYRFVRAVGFIRVFAALSALLILVTLILIPSTETATGDDGRAGAALNRILNSLERAAFGSANVAYDLGSDFADTLFAQAPSDDTESDGLGVATPTPLMTLTAGSQPSRAPATSTQVTEKATVTPIPRSSLPIEVGSRVVVVTGGARLRARSEPSLAGEIIVYFDLGTELEVVGGPVSADNLVWWEVEGTAGRGWSAQRFLSREEPGQ